MRVKKFNDEVYYLEDNIPVLTGEVFEFLKSKALQNERARCRICTHESPESSLHEMFILHSRGNYVPPHRHLRSDESLTIISGEAAMIYFEHDGPVREVHYLNPAQKGAAMYLRTPKGVLHSLYIESDFCLFKETIEGPFSPDNNFEPSWSPDKLGSKTVADFMKRSKELFDFARDKSLSKSE